MTVVFYVCDCCGERADVDEVKFDNYGKPICPNCANDEYTYCFEEECYVRNDEVVEVDGNYYSEQYAQEYFDQCCVCGEYFGGADVFEIVGEDDEYICHRCLHLNPIYCVCDECDRAYIPIDNEDCLCEECRRHNAVHDYYYKPEPHFYLQNGEEEGTLYMGVELEIEHPRHKEFARSLPDEIYAKHDGSLGVGGVELVSHPCTLQYHYNLWKDILAKARHEGASSHNNYRCGLHVHLSRDYFNGNVDIFKFGMLFDKFWDNIVRFSRRVDGQISQWACRSNYELFDVEARHENSIRRKLQQKRGSESRYTCVNLQNLSTIEVRIFRGTLREESFFAALELCQVFADFAKNNDVPTICDATWGDVIESQKTIYLKSYCDYRSIDPTTTGESLLEKAPPCFRVDIPKIKNGDLVRIKDESRFYRVLDNGASFDGLTITVIPLNCDSHNWDEVVKYRRNVNIKTDIAMVAGIRQPRRIECSFVPNDCSSTCNYTTINGYIIDGESFEGYTHITTTTATTTGVEAEELRFV